MGKSPTKAPPSASKGQRTLASFFGGGGAGKKAGGGGGDAAPAPPKEEKAPLKDASNSEGRVSD